MSPSGWSPHASWFARLRACWILILTWFGCASIALAHQASDGYLTLTVTNQVLEGRLDLAIRDLDAILEIDDNSDGSVTWGELKNHQADLAQYVTSHLTLLLDGQTNSLGELELLTDEHAGGGFAVCRFVRPWIEKPRTLDVFYRCVFDVDALHRGFLKLEREGKIVTAMFSPDRPSFHFQFGTPLVATHGWHQFVREGVWHIWTGYDHVLFLLALLLPAVVRREDGQWCAVAKLRPALWRILQTVTAFTVAHSITLSLAALDQVHMSPRIVEPVIAASVALAAANNLWPLIHDRGWIVAFVFGLIHGFGFASVLQGMDLTGGSLAWPLLGFNLGVEIGQAAIVLIFVPLAFMLRGTTLYRVGALRFGSAGIVLIAAAWFLERLLGTG